jgi:hypothetical protein
MTAVTTNSNNKQEGEDVNILINIFSRLHHMTAMPEPLKTIDRERMN